MLARDAQNNTVLAMAVHAGSKEAFEAVLEAAQDIVKDAQVR